MKKPIHIIDCALEDKALETFERLKDKYDCLFEYHIPSMEGMDSLRQSQLAAAYMVLGSDSSVNDRLPWQRSLAQYLKQMCHQNIPIMGICFGYQLMADALGAKVQTAGNRPYSPEENIFSGVRKVKIIEDYFGFKTGEEFQVFKAHSQEVVEITEDFIHLGTSSDCYYDILAHKKFPFLGVQTHPEAGEVFVEREITASLNPPQIKESMKDGDLIIDKFISSIY
jgi:GMP synthase (glutamine-hydrolysing)